MISAPLSSPSTATSTPIAISAMFRQASGARIMAAHDAAHPYPLSHLEASRALLGLAAPARGGAPFLARGVVSSRRKTSRVVIARTIIDGSTSDMRESSGVSDGKLARRLIGKASLTLPRQQSERHRARNVGLGISSKLRQCPAPAYNG
jgi:hypothetical protein